MVVYLCVLIVFSLRLESLKMILVDKPPHFWGGSVTVGYQSKIEVKHSQKYLKIATTLSVRNS